MGCGGGRVACRGQTSSTAPSFATAVSTTSCTAELSAIAEIAVESRNSVAMTLPDHAGARSLRRMP